MDNNNSVQYQITGKFSDNNIPVNTKTFNKKFNESLKGVQTIQIEKDGSFSFGEYNYFKKVKKFRKNITKIIEGNNIEFGI
jgi:hypothetical protein